MKNTTRAPLTQSEETYSCPGTAGGASMYTLRYVYLAIFDIKGSRLLYTARLFCNSSTLRQRAAEKRIYLCLNKTQSQGFVYTVRCSYNWAKHPECGLRPVGVFNRIRK